MLEAATDDLPIEAPPPRELWVNRNTASAIGLTLPAALLSAAVKIVG